MPFASLYDYHIVGACVYFAFLTFEITLWVVGLIKHFGHPTTWTWVGFLVRNCFYLLMAATSARGIKGHLLAAFRYSTSHCRCIKTDKLNE